MRSFRLADLIDDRPKEGVFRINSAMYSDPELFELEMHHVFERGWVFLGLSCQVRNPFDYMTTNIGRVPVIVSRDAHGELHCILNSCSHKGARIARTPTGNSRVHVCPYHGWTFDCAGRNKLIKWEKSGCYASGFGQENHDLKRVARFGNYKGFLFGSLNAEVVPLEEHLGEASHLIDLIADQSPDGPELVPGRVRFTYAGNWKMQLENCSDQYHFTSTHNSYIRILEQRAAEQRAETVESNLVGGDFWRGGNKDIAGGSFGFRHGHVLAWGRMAPSASSPLYERSEELASRLGQARREWIFNMRNLTLFPNVQVAENASSQLRRIRPISVNLTEVETWCLAPTGESAKARTQRLRQYEDFFNPTGMAIPDDNACYEECQAGLQGRDGRWTQGHARGLGTTQEGGNWFSQTLGMTPDCSVAGTSDLADEALFRCYYRAWANRMSEALS